MQSSTALDGLTDLCHRAVCSWVQQNKRTHAQGQLLEGGWSQALPCGIQGSGLWLD